MFLLKIQENNFKNGNCCKFVAAETIDLHVREGKVDVQNEFYF